MLEDMCRPFDSLQFDSLVQMEGVIVISDSFDSFCVEIPLEQWVSGVAAFNYSARTFMPQPVGLRGDDQELRFGSEYSFTSWGLSSRSAPPPRGQWMLRPCVRAAANQLIEALGRRRGSLQLTEALGRRRGSLQLIGPPKLCSANGVCSSGCYPEQYTTRVENGVNKSNSHHEPLSGFPDESGEGWHDEFMEVFVETAVRVTEVHVYESYFPGATVRVDLLAPDGLWDTVYDGVVRTGLHPYRMEVFVIFVCQRNYLTRALRLWFNTSAIKGWNCFDAVKVMGDTEIPSGLVPGRRGQLVYVPFTNYKASAAQSCGHV
ncbi:hypothetical protein CYMTET_33348 [Cymbomonas tetramitiformis]|uniref:Uncharacterized protein n=1 Tax=Cymbomonas tetramitiformis TaxID=36881 RepID=A0AAE0KRA0_9CHLO|nr:hypothetical protein CYMTET_33348 [Cymbomonas tetramitiformis]